MLAYSPGSTGKLKVNGKTPKLPHQTSRGLRCFRDGSTQAHWKPEEQGHDTGLRMRQQELNHSQIILAVTSLSSFSVGFGEISSFKFYSFFIRELAGHPDEERTLRS